MTQTSWTELWFWWLFAVFITWLLLELDSIYAAHVVGTTNLSDWTLSDTIRRWAKTRRWLSPVVVGSTAFLLMHFFAEGNL